MRINDFLKQITTKFNVHRDDVIRSKTKYTNLYRQAMLQLYAAGGISDPSRFSQKDVIQYLLEEGYNIIELSGRYSLDEAVLLREIYREDYKMGIAKTGRSLRTFEDSYWSVGYAEYPSPVRMVYNIVRLRRLLDSIDKFYTVNKFSSRKRHYVSNKTSYVFGIFKSSGSFSITEATADILKGTESEVKFYPLWGGLWRGIYSMLDLDLPESDEEESQFITGISVSQEKELLPMLIDMKFEMDGEYGHEYHKYVDESKWNSDTGITVTLRSVIAEKGGDNSRAVYEGVIDDVIATDETVLGVTSEGIYTSVRSNKNVIVTGQYVVDSYADEISGNEAFIFGSTGEFIPYDENNGEEYGVELEYDNTCPVNVYWGDGYREMYDTEFLPGAQDLRGGKTWFAEENISLQFNSLNRDKLLKLYNLSTVVDAIRTSFDFGESGFFGPLLVEDAEGKKFIESANLVAKEL